MFAAFPEWYASLFSGFYLALLLILLALIGRGVAFEYRGKREDPRWRARWDHVIVVGSLVPAFLWGVAFANIVRGVKLDLTGEYVGSLVDLLNPYALLGGLTTLALFTLHGAVFLALKTRGEIRVRAAQRPAVRLAHRPRWSRRRSWRGPCSVCAAARALPRSPDSPPRRWSPGSPLSTPDGKDGPSSAPRSRSDWRWRHFTSLYPNVLPSSLKTV